jgi:hypothetical protein
VVDPEPRIPPPLSAEHLAQPAQELAFDRFLELRDGDVLFVDTTHTVKLGSEVNRIVLDVLPRLAPGVAIHFHDIFLPYEYPRAFVAGGAYLTEQYLLHAYLCENQSYDIGLALHALARDRKSELGRLLNLGSDQGLGPSAFWIRRLGADHPRTGAFDC